MYAAIIVDQKINRGLVFLVETQELSQRIEIMYRPLSYESWTERFSVLNKVVYVNGNYLSTIRTHGLPTLYQQGYGVKFLIPPPSSCNSVAGVSEAQTLNSWVQILLRKKDTSIFRLLRMLNDLALIF